jgi:hypothetical protein
MDTQVLLDPGWVQIDFDPVWGCYQASLTDSSAQTTGPTSIQACYADLPYGEVEAPVRYFFQTNSMPSRQRTQSTRIQTQFLQAGYRKTLCTLSGPSTLVP